MAPRNHIYSSVELTPDEGNAEQVQEEHGETDMPGTESAEMADSQLGDGVKVPTRIVWRNVVIMAALHIASVYAFLFLTWKCRANTLLWGKCLCS